MTIPLVLLHSAFGATRGMQAVAEALAPTGREILAPDYLRGRVFTTESAAIAHRDALGADTLFERVRADLAGVPDEASFVGFSLGAACAQRLVAERPSMGHLVLVGHVAPVRGPWPGVPVQVHRLEQDRWVTPEHVGALAEAVQLSGAAFEDHVTPGRGHLVTERHLPEYDPVEVQALVARVHDFLDWA